jgi:hypothetical protein
MGFVSIGEILAANTRPTLWLRNTSGAHAVFQGQIDTYKMSPIFSEEKISYKLTVFAKLGDQYGSCTITPGAAANAGFSLGELAKFLESDNITFLDINCLKSNSGFDLEYLSIEGRPPARLN